MTTDDPPVFDCRARRHKVLAGDGICVLCGARGVVDARRLPPPSRPQQQPALESLLADVPTSCNTDTVAEPRSQMSKGPGDTVTGPAPDAQRGRADEPGKTRRPNQTCAVFRGGHPTPPGATP